MPTPTISPMYSRAPAHGAASFKAAALQEGIVNSTNQSKVVNLSGGKKHRNKRGGTVQTATVPRMLVLPASPTNGTPNSTQNLANRGGQASLQAAQGGGFDDCRGYGPSCTAAVQASQAGGKRRSKKWGRMSGGKSHSVNWGV